MNRASTPSTFSQRRVAGAVIGLALVATAACGGDDGSNACADFSQPQILPSETPVCLGPVAIPADVNELTPTPRSIVLESLGSNDLQITDVQIEGDERGHFSLQGVDPMLGSSVSCPETAAVGVLYRPTTPGWDTIDLVVQSNAQNFPTLRVFYLALAVPADDPDYVIPDKPMEAQAGPDTPEACPDL